MKIKKIFLIMFMIFVILGCETQSVSSISEKKYDIMIDANIYFSNIFTIDNDEKNNLKEINQVDFEINKEFYVYVDFNIVNNLTQDEIIDFEAQIWESDYLSTWDFKHGLIESKFTKTTNTDIDGNVRNIVKITNMQFGIKAGEKLSFNYCFELVPKEVGVNLEFQIFFISKYNNRNIFNDNPELGTKKYNFIEGTSEGE